MKGGSAVDVPACFMSSHEGFRGTIKNLTKDFVVIEIDINGQLVNTSAAVSAAPRIPGKPSHSSALPEKRLKFETSQVCRQYNSLSVTQNASNPVDSKNEDSDLMNFDLNLVLGQSVYEDLEQFVATLNDVPRSLREETRKPAGQELSLSLGSFPDKDQRATVHRAVRRHFPFLMTVTNQPEISVRVDPDYTELSRLVTDEEAEDFFRFIDAKASGTSYTFRPDEIKEHRTAVHHFLSCRFGKLVETKSFVDQGETAITVRLRERVRPRKRTAAEDEVYTAFTLCKENLETLEAISYMAATLGVLPSDFTYAGIKDKRAITYQAMVVKKVSVKRLKEKIAELERRGLRLSQVCSVSEPLKLGRLQGNHFDLVVRDLRIHEPSAAGLAKVDSSAGMAELVQQAVENVKDRGFVNYYGPQRFGTSQSVQSDRVGLALLKEDMVGAVRLFFAPGEGNEPHNQAKRHFLHTDNAKESLALMPSSKARERLMLRALHRYGRGVEGCARAWFSLPHGMRVFYPHAYCSRLWNEAVAHRLASLGHGVKQGDLVWLQQNSEEAALPQIHAVTGDEERDGIYTLGQVVLPMPGNTVRYPENAMGTWYRERLARDGLEDCRFRVSKLKLNLPGCYRPLLAFPRDLTYRLEGFADGKGGEEEEEREVPGVTHEVEGNSEVALNGGTSQTRRESGSMTLSLNFDLDTSCYATVCLREMMKCDV